MNRRRPRHWEALARGPGTCSTRSTTAFPSPLAPSWRHLGRDQVPDAHQVVQRGSQGKQPPHAAHPPVTGFPEEGHGLEPAEHLFDELALLLTDGVPRMAGRPRVDRTDPLRHVLRDM